MLSFILSFIGLLVVIAAGYLIVKLFVDRKHMVDKAKNVVGKICKNADKIADAANCYVDTSISQLGYMKTMNLLNGTQQPSFDDMEVIGSILLSCSQNCQS